MIRIVLTRIQLKVFRTSPVVVFGISIYVGMPSSNFRLLTLLPVEQDLSQNFETLWNGQARCAEQSLPRDRFGTRAMEKVLEKVRRRWNISIDQPAMIGKCFHQIRFRFELSKLFSKQIIRTCRICKHFVFLRIMCAPIISAPEDRADRVCTRGARRSFLHQPMEITNIELICSILLRLTFPSIW